MQSRMTQNECSLNYLKDDFEVCVYVWNSSGASHSIFLTSCGKTCTCSFLHGVTGRCRSANLHTQPKQNTRCTESPHVQLSARPGFKFESPTQWMMFTLRSVTSFEQIWDYHSVPAAAAHLCTVPENQCCKSTLITQDYSSSLRTFDVSLFSDKNTHFGSTMVQTCTDDTLVISYSFHLHPNI